MRARRWPGLVATLVCLIGCLGDPVGPGGTLVVRRLSPLDSMLVGAPGRPLPAPITFQVVDGDGRPVPGAVLTWTVAGADGRVDHAPGATDSRGEASVLWQLGTKASEGQQLTAQVAVGKHRASATVVAIAKPVEVSSIAFGARDTTLVKFGVATPLAIQATDPFGNKFVPVGTRFVSLDTSLCLIDSLGSVRARKRGFARVVALAGSAADTAWVHPTQVVHTIVATPDTVRFHSLGQMASLAVQLVDDQGLSVRDSLATDSVVVDTVVKVQAGSSYTIRSLSNGMTPVILRAGAVAQTVQVVVHQRVASVKLSASRVDLDALGDTVQMTTTVSDSLGAPLANPVLAYSAGDTSVVTVGPSGLVTSKGNGATWIHATARNGGTDSVGIVVAQQVARVVPERDSLRFDALQAVLALRATALDRLGSPVPTAALTYTSGAPSVATVDLSGNIRAIANGNTEITASYGSYATSVAVRVAQRPVRIVVPADTARFAALGDTRAIWGTGVDSLGSPVTNMAVTLKVADTTVVEQVDSVTVRSRANGATVATLTVGSIAAQMAIIVTQRVASVKLAANRETFDALGDTIQFSTIVSDSLGAPVANQALAYTAGDTSIVRVGPGGLVTSTGNGSTWIHAKATNGVADSVRLEVAQQVARVVAKRDSILFDALQAALPVQASPVDRLGSPVTAAALTYATGAQSVAAVDPSGNIRAIGNGETVVTAASGGDTAFVAVRVAQRPVRVAPSIDTVRFVAFGDTQSVRAVAVDSLGSPVPGQVTGVLVHDTAVGELLDSVTVRAHGNGVTMASFTVAGVAGEVTVIVDQVPTTLTAAVTFGNPVVTLPVGAALPVTCQALDKNGFDIARDPAFLGSVRGTVTGTRCGDTRVERSGYDTLLFALGPTRARVPVIVSTASDSVAVVAAAQPLTTVQRDLFVGEDLANPLILALRPLVADILAAYGNPTTSLERARAIRDWVARTAIHPNWPIHPDGSTSNLSVLPPGETWAHANAAGRSKIQFDSQYWGAVGMDGYAMLNRLLGTLDPTTGQRGDDGMMVLIGNARYQIRDVQTYHYVLCSFQDIMLDALWAAAGLHGMLISTVGHDPAAVFIPELGRWVYEDPEFDDEYVLDGTGDPLSPIDLLAFSSAGQVNRLQARKLLGPSFDPEVYVAGEAYISGTYADGMVIMGSQLNNRVVGIGGWPMRYVQIDVPQLAQESPFNNTLIYDRVTAPVAFPTLGVAIQQMQVQDSVSVIELSSTFPNHQRFERRLNGGAWENASDLDVLPVGQCRVEYRSVDAVGSISATTVLDVWVPRGSGFIESGVPGGLRSQARYCVSSSGPGLWFGL